MIEVFDCAQYSPEWWACRLAIPTASNFADVLAKGRGGKDDSKTRRTYLMKLLGERITGEPAYSYQNEHMERGLEMEAEARAAYAFMTDEEPVSVGFIRNGRKGCSPDSLIGANGLCQIKTRLAHLQAELLLSKEVPPEHKPQLQGELLVSEREWVDLCSYWPKMPVFIKRVYRDEPYIKSLASAIDIFNAELDTLYGEIVGKELKVA